VGRGRAHFWQLKLSKYTSFQSFIKFQIIIIISEMSPPTKIKINNNNNNNNNKIIIIIEGCQKCSKRLTINYTQPVLMCMLWKK
jgi:hypothetical protein